MAYKALYRRYRPSKFEDFAGQKQVVEIIQKAIKNSKVAHAYLFCGPRGTGKTSMAKMLAKSVNCTNENKPCEMCENCIQANNNIHGDIIELDAASNNGVDQIRDIIEKSKYLPVIGKYKVYIIDEVHMLTSSSFNALLKILEEPPTHVIFILATTEPHKILPTIISRCQRFNFLKVNNEDIVKRMMNLLEKENVIYTIPALNSIAELSGGGVRDALSLLEQVVATGNEVNEEMVSFIFGKKNVSEYISLISSIINNEFEKLLVITNDIIEKGNDLKKITNDIINICKSIIIYNKTENTKLISGIEFKKEDLEIIKMFDTAQILKIANIMMECEEKYKLVDNIETLFELSMIKALSAVEHKVVVNDIKEEVNKEIVEIVEEEVSDECSETVSSKTIVKETNSINEKEEIKPNNLKTIIETINRYTKEELLNLFVGANKTYRREDEEKYLKKNSLLSNMKIARYANLIKNCKIVASGSDYIVLMEEFEPNINLINEITTNMMIETMFKEELGIDKKVICVGYKDYVEVINEYKRLAQQDKLPKFQNITKDKVVSEEVVEVNETEEKLKRYFGKEILKIGE